MAVAVGMSYTWQIRVEPEMSAEHWGNAGVAVFSTPHLVGLLEMTSVRAVQDHLEPGEATVGTVVNVKHLKATPVGETMTFTSEVVEVDGRRVVFHVSASDAEGLAGEGTHERFVVDLARFMARIEARQRAAG